ncbi:MAG: hypothetical protein QM785_05740 [Pyrinomonadaceae bacterium]
MPITDAPFDSEKELESWVYENIGTFSPDCVLIPGFRITTPSGKHGVPDGFVFNFRLRSWWIVECELLRHGVWPHIAEQLTRFVVAGQNPSTLRQLRDRLFDVILSRGLEEDASMFLDTDATRLFQKLELFIEGVQPSIAVFIDDTNQDLTDFCNALDVPTEIYRVKKFLVNGRSEYYSPDKSEPAIATLPSEAARPSSTAYDAIERLGGGEVVNSRLNVYKLADGRVVKLQYSKFHESHQTYWFGISPRPYQTAKELGVSEIVFVLGEEGFVVVPTYKVDAYLESAYQTKNPDGSIRHYHMYISPAPDVFLKAFTNGDDIDVRENFTSWN